jgi:hypothetical protein
LGFVRREQLCQYPGYGIESHSFYGWADDVQGQEIDPSVSEHGCDQGETMSFGSLSAETGANGQYERENG